MASDEFQLFDLFNCNSIRKMFRMLYENQHVQDTREQPTLEVVNASFVADNFAIFGLLDDDYLQKELDWYLTEKQNINAMTPPVPSLWKSSAGPNGETNSNYGWCVFSEENGSQYEYVRNELIVSPTSRRAQMIYTRPSMHTDYRELGKNDFMCTNTVQYLIRNNKLETIVSMRSNDAVFGYKCDRFWQMHVRNRLHNDLTKMKYPSLMRGSIYWNVGSLHVYERHFYLIDGYIRTGNPHLTRKEYNDLQDIEPN